MFYCLLAVVGVCCLVGFAGYDSCFNSVVRFTLNYRRCISWVGVVWLCAVIVLLCLCVFYLDGCLGLCTLCLDVGVWVLVFYVVGLLACGGG